MRGTRNHHLRLVRYTIYALVAIGLPAGLGSGCRTATTPTNPDAPQVQAMSPAVVFSSTDPQLLAFSGINFIGSFTVVVTGPDGTPTTFGPSDLRAVSANTFSILVVLQTPGAYVVQVTNPSGDQSNGFVMTIRGVTAAPVVVSANPPSTSAKSQPQEIVVTGANFLDGLTIRLSSPDGTVSIVSAPDIQLVTPTSFQANLILNKIGAYSAIVVNPSGDSSNPFQINVTK
jgi:hypothetical protein